MNKEITLRTLRFDGNDYLLPEDMTRKDLAELIATLAALRPVCNKFKMINKAWCDAHYLGDMVVSAGSRTIPQLFPSGRAAEDHLKNLEQAAAHPESAF